MEETKGQAVELPFAAEIDNGTSNALDPLVVEQRKDEFLRFARNMFAPSDGDVDASVESQLARRYGSGEDGSRYSPESMIDAALEALSSETPRDNTVELVVVSAALCGVSDGYRSGDVLNALFRVYDTVSPRDQMLLAWHGHEYLFSERCHTMLQELVTSDRELAFQQAVLEMNICRFGEAVRLWRSVVHEILGDTDAEHTGPVLPDAVNADILYMLSEVLLDQSNEVYDVATGMRCLLLSYEHGRLDSGVVFATLVIKKDTMLGGVDDIPGVCLSADHARSILDELLKNEGPTANELKGKAAFVYAMAFHENLEGWCDQPAVSLKHALTAVTCNYMKATCICVAALIVAANIGDPDIVEHVPSVVAMLDELYATELPPEAQPLITQQMVAQVKERLASEVFGHSLPLI